MNGHSSKEASRQKNQGSGAAATPLVGLRDVSPVLDKHVGYGNVIEVEGARRAVEEHQPRVGCSGRKIGVDYAHRGAIEPDLPLPIGGLGVLNLQAVPGVGRD